MAAMAAGCATWTGATWSLEAPPMGGYFLATAWMANDACVYIWRIMVYILYTVCIYIYIYIYKCVYPARIIFRVSKNRHFFWFQPVSTGDFNEKIHHLNHLWGATSKSGKSVVLYQWFGLLCRKYALTICYKRLLPNSLQTCHIIYHIYIYSSTKRVYRRYIYSYSTNKHNNYNWGAPPSKKLKDWTSGLKSGRDVLYCTLSGARCFLDKLLWFRFFLIQNDNLCGSIPQKYVFFCMGDIPNVCWAGYYLFANLLNSRTRTYYIGLKQLIQVLVCAWIEWIHRFQVISYTLCQSLSSTIPIIISRFNGFSPADRKTPQLWGELTSPPIDEFPRKKHTDTP